jgi:putative endonuclease
LADWYIRETFPGVTKISLLAQYRLALFERTTGWLDRQSVRTALPMRGTAHLTTGLRGEDAAYFYLRSQGYVIVARRWRSTRLRGDIDLIGWDGDSLCFIEVKTRTSRNFRPAECAVDHDKRHMLHRMAQAYIRQMENFDQISVRFDIVSVYFSEAKPEFELFRGAFA